MSAAVTLRRFLLLIIWAEIVFNLVHHGLHVPLASHSADFAKHWAAARSLLDGSNPFLGEHYFSYPLLTAYLFLYLGLFTHDEAKVLWVTGNVIMSAAAALIVALFYRPGPAVRERATSETIARLHRVLRRDWFTAAFFITFNFQPLIDAFLPLNVDPLNFLLSTAFVAAVLHHRERLAGVLLTVFVLVKLLPLTVVAAAFVARRWRLLQAFLVSIAAYLAFLGLTGLWRFEMDLFTKVLSGLSFKFIWISNSIHVVLARLFAPGMLQDLDLFQRWSGTITLLLGGGYVAALALWWRRPRPEPLSLYLFALAAGVTLTPLLELHHFLWVAPALFVQLRLWAEGRLSPFLAGACLASWLGLNAIRIVADYGIVPAGVFPVYWLTPIPLLGVLGTTACMAFTPCERGPQDRESREKMSQTEHLPQP